MADQEHIALVYGETTARFRELQDAWSPVAAYIVELSHAQDLDARYVELVRRLKDFSAAFVGLVPALEATLDLAKSEIERRG